MDKNSKIYVSGHEGMVGSLLLDELNKRGYSNIVVKAFKELDLRNQKETDLFISLTKPDYVFLVAGKVGGIGANIRYPATFLYDNLMISANVIESSRKNNIKKLLYIGSSCIYPRLSKQPMKEDYLLTGSLEPTNEGYAIGKIAGLKLCEYYNKQYGSNYISVMPPNLYGPRDSFSLEDSHVISALIQKIHKAKINNEKKIEMWGTGSARREFLFNEDFVDGLLYIFEHYNETSLINLGSSNDVSIRELAEIIKDIVNYSGDFYWDSEKPDGMPKKLMDSSKVNNLGWRSKTSLEMGLKKTYEWYCNNIEGVK